MPDEFTGVCEVLHCLLDWFTSSAGIRTQAATALVFQLAGIALVVWEIIDTNAQFQRLIGRFAEIHRDRDEHLRELQELSAKASSPTASPALQIGGLVGIPDMQSHTVSSALEAKLHELTEYQDEHRKAPWRPWRGAVFLLLGVVFSFTCAISGVH